MKQTIRIIYPQGCVKRKIIQTGWRRGGGDFIITAEKTNYNKIMSQPFYKSKRMLNKGCAKF